MKSIDTPTEETILYDIEDIILRFEQSLSKRVDAAAMTHKSKIPFKILTAREVLFHRMTAIARSAFDLHKQDKRVSAYILMRSALETSALNFLFSKKINHFLSDFNVDKIDKFLMQCLAGGRDRNAQNTPVHIMDCIRAVNKEYDGFEEMYGVLCEYAHPNFMGGLDSFGKIDHKNFWLDLGAELKEPPAAFGLGPFLMSLAIYEEHYKLIGDNFYLVDDHFENLQN